VAAEEPIGVAGAQSAGAGAPDCSELLASGVVPPGAGTPVPVLGIVHKVDGSQLAAPVTLLEGVLEPGRLIPPHTHTREDEVSFVVAGTVTFWIDGRSHLAPPGSYVIKPRGLPHAIWNATDEVARLVEIHSPGGQARYYDSLAELLVAPGLDDAERAARIAEMQAGWGITAHPEVVPSLIADHGFHPQHPG
jgi:quercetin dioxygenase-like cupin family protein